MVSELRIEISTYRLRVRASSMRHAFRWQHYIKSMRTFIHIHLYMLKDYCSFCFYINSMCGYKERLYIKFAVRSLHRICGVSFSFVAILLSVSKKAYNASCDTIRYIFGKFNLFLCSISVCPFYTPYTDKSLSASGASVPWIDAGSGYDRRWQRKQCSFFTHQGNEGEMDDAILTIDKRKARTVENVW